MAHHVALSADERVQRILAMSTADRWPERREATPVPMDELTGDVAKAVASDRVRLELPRGRWPLPVVLGDRDRLALALFQLLADVVDRSGSRTVRVNVAQTATADGIVVDIAVRSGAPSGPVAVDEQIAAVAAEHGGRLERTTQLIRLYLPA